MSVQIEIHKKLENFNLNVQIKSDSRRIGILGESGCGKSMTLKSIAGVESVDAGQIRIDDKVIYDSAQKINLKPQKRNVGYLFQNYALFPTMTVKENIAAGVKTSKKEKEQRVQEMVEKFQLKGLENHYPSQLSGGQQQRAALARVLAYRPDIILLDEPFSALDMFLKDRLQQEMMELLSDYEGIVILVSHSRDEIYRFSDELFIMHGGEIVREGNVKEVFENPKRIEAARLTGCKNIAKISRKDQHDLFVPDWNVNLHFENTVTEEISHIGIRAHDFIPVWGEKEDNCISVQISSIAELPFEEKYFLKSENASNEICWFVQRELSKEIKEKGIPPYLKIPEKSILLLKEK